MYKAKARFCASLARRGLNQVPPVRKNNAESRALDKAAAEGRRRELLAYFERQRQAGIEPYGLSAKDQRAWEEFKSAGLDE